MMKGYKSTGDWEWMTWKKKGGDSMDIDEAKCCPFCGSEDIGLIKKKFLTNLHNSYYIMCDKCEAEGPASDSCRQAIVKWNERITLHD
jgi:Lar family restriction alleviation protein